MTSDHDKPWARRLRIERERRAWTRADVARRIRSAARNLGIGGLPSARIIRGYTHGWEAGSALPDWKYQTLLAAVFGLSVRELFGGAAILTIPPMLAASTGGTVEIPYFARAEDDIVQRRKLLAWLAALAAGTATLPDSLRNVARTTGDAPDLLPTITMKDVADLDAANTMFTRWEHQVGGAVTRQAATTHVSWALAQIEAGVPAKPAVRDAWRITTARLAQTAGWMTHDAHREPQARALLVLGYRIASSVEHVSTGEPARAFLLTQLARQAVAVGRPQTGLEIARYAQTIAEVVSPTTRYRLHAVKARAHAALGDRAMMLRELGLMEEEYSRTGAEDLIREPWGRHWQHTGQMHYNIGAAYDLLSRANPEDVNAADITRAADAYTTSASLWGDWKERDRTSARLRAATVLLAAKEHEQAVGLVREALLVLPQLRSQRLQDDVGAFRTVAAPYRRRPDVSALVRDLSELPE